MHSPNPDFLFKLGKQKITSEYQEKIRQLDLPHKRDEIINYGKKLYDEKFDSEYSRSLKLLNEGKKEIEFEGVSADDWGGPSVKRWMERNSIQASVISTLQTHYKSKLQMREGKYHGPGDGSGYYDNSHKIYFVIKED